MAGGWSGTLRKLDDFRWEIPKSYKAGMRVPGLVFADEAMLTTIREDQALEQVANVACLPGIVDHSLAMPDIHWGYGFPVGGVAAMRLTDGVVSPGGIGYDINCLPGDSNVLLADGASIRLDALVASRLAVPLSVLRLGEGSSESGRVTRYQVRRSDPRVVKLRTEAGDELVATADHPLWTPDGMRPSGSVRAGDLVGVRPFVGPEYERPQHLRILDEADVRSAAARLGRTSCDAEIGELRRRGLLPLYLDDERTAALLRLLGYITGDGTIGASANVHATAFWGEPDDLLQVRRDVSLIGFTPSRVYVRDRQHAETTRYGEFRFDHHESCVRVSARSFATLLCGLGAPAGNKATPQFEVPAWVRDAPVWHKRLYLAALFGAELSAPSMSAEYNLCCPCLGMNKSSEALAGGRRFLEQIRVMLGHLGVEGRVLSEREEDRARDGSARWRLRLIVCSRPENLVRLFARVGYVYHRRKSALSAAYAQYLKRKMTEVNWRGMAAETARTLHSDGEPVGAIALELASTVNRRFVERALYEETSGEHRVPLGYQTFAEYLEWAAPSSQPSEFLWERVASVEEVEHPGPFYDLTVDHPDHNFAANGFVVSNCGVRLLSTTLTEADVHPRITDVANQLFRDVPSGMGQEGRLPLQDGELDRVLEGGAEWMVGQGYGRAADLDHIEERGRVPGASAAEVSARAKSRGSDQLGTLGSGNHFLEVQVVDRIFEQRAAERFGLGEVGRVAVFIHTGSRGLGHQVCEDFLRVAEANLGRYGITLPDRQLACMPYDSPEAKRYLAAMAAAANFAFANRQLIAHWVREALARVLKRPAESLGLDVVYDVAHNIAKLEEYEVEGKRQTLCVHRKGATRAFPAGDPTLPEDYRDVGQPVLIPGDMGRYSFVAVGTERAMRESFGSVCHGAGRLQSRGAMRRSMKNVDLVSELGAHGITVKVHSRGGLVEEASAAYKDVADVMRVVAGADLARPVLRLRPIAVIKG